MGNFEDCITGGSGSEDGCYNTAINASQMLTGMVINLVIGLLCYVGFVLWRGNFRVYFNRLVSPEVPPEQRPPKLKLGSHWQLWSWLIPVFTVSDEELLQQTGLDALVAQRIMGFGCVCLFPLTILGIGVLLPVYYTSYITPVASTTTTSTETNSTAKLNDEFLKMTLSAVPNGAGVLWVPFFFTYVFIGWVCWLILLYYKEFISLRQAHDQLLIESTTVDRRSSLLDDRSPRGSGPQIMSSMRAASMVHRRSSASEMLGDRAFGSAPPDYYAGVAGGSTAGVVAAGGPPAGGLQQTSSSVASVAGSASASMSISGGGKLVRRLSRAAPAPACDALPGPQARISTGSQGAPEGQQAGGAELIQYHVVTALGRLSGSGAQQQPAEAQGPTSAAGGGQGSAGDVLPPSPFAGEGLGAAPPPRASLQPALRRITDSDGEGELSGDEGGPDAERLGGSAKRGSGAAGGAAEPHWDELCEPLPLPLVASADAAQFYTVLIIDEAVEEFAYSKSLGKAWVPDKLLNKLASRGRSDSQSIFEKSKALMKRKSRSEEERELANTCNLRMQVAEDLYAGIFGEDFDRIVPVYKTHATDALLARWHRKRLLLDRLHLQQQRVREQQERLKEEVAAQIEAAERQLAELEGQQEAAAEAAAPDPELGEQPGAAAAAAAGAAGGEAAPAAGEPQAAGQDQPSGGSIAQAASSRLIPAGSQAGPGSGKLARSGSSHGEDGPPGGSMKQPAAAGTAAGTASTACGGWHFGLQSTSLVARHEQRAEKLKARQEKLVQQVAETEAELAELQGKVEQAQRNAAEARPAPCFFATFHTAHAAAYAGRLNLNPLHERMMRVMPAPAPRNVNWSALFRSWVGRGVRPMPVFVAVLVMLLFPIGMFAGICGTIVSSICVETPDGAKDAVNAANTWFCSDARFATFLRNFISSTLPAILLSVWQAVVLPIYFYNCAQATAQYFSLSDLDLACARWFFLHDLFNVFLGGMLGGSIVWGIRAIINEPGQFFTILGQAVPASSNFFINYVSYKAIAMSFFRLFFPHAAVFGAILKWLRIVPRPKTERDKEAAALPINCRYSRDIGVLQLTVFLVVLSYGIVTPIILAFGLLYFLMWWPVWRYQMLYVYQGHYDCHGYYWVYAAHRLVICLGAMATFTSAILAVKAAYVQGLVLLCTSLAFLWWFDRYLTFRYDNVVDQAPAVGIHHAPRARVDDCLYVPAPMQRRAAGWTPEWGKAWIGYGAPRYGL